MPLVDQIPELAVGQLLPGASWEVAGYVERTWCPGWLHLSDSCVAGTYLQGIPSEVPLEQSEAHTFHRQTANTARVGVSPVGSSQNHKVRQSTQESCERSIHIFEVWCNCNCNCDHFFVVQLSEAAAKGKASELAHPSQQLQQPRSLLQVGYFPIPWDAVFRFARVWLGSIRSGPSIG